MSSEGGESTSNVSEEERRIDTKPYRVACIGGGQLGRMMAMEAPRLNIQMSFLDPLGSNSPAACCVPTGSIVQGTLNDIEKIQYLVQTTQPDIITVETEHINVIALQQLEQSGYNVQPSSRVMRIIQDKFLQKEHFSSHKIAVPPFAKCNSITAIHDAITKFGLPIMLKSRHGGYDGKGNAVIDSKESVIDAVQKLLPSLSIDTIESTADLDLYAEGWVPFVSEVAVMVVRSSMKSTTTSHTVCYPVVHAIQQDSICRIVLAPAPNISPKVREVAEQLAIQAIDTLGDGASGMFGVELFVTADDTVLLNEVAPRPHNTGHYTQDACTINQFENHLRAICGYPLGSTKMIVNVAAMVNVLGPASQNSIDALVSSNTSLQNDTHYNSTVHWYSKQDVRAGRKMGHINLTATSFEELLEPITKLMEIEKIPLSLLPSLSSNVRATKQLSSKPIVGVVMGSQSDLPTMQEAVQILQQFNVPYEVDIVSAHRTPDKLMSYARNAVTRGIQVIIAGAGGAAHLPGMVASMTPLPVIGVPIKTSTLNGIDSLYSIVQMPKGIPVATVAIGNATNAGLLAVRMVGMTNPIIQQAMITYQNKLRDTVEDASSRLIELGSDNFLQQMDNKNKSVNV